MKQKISIRDKKKISLSKHKVPKIKTKTVKAMYLKSIVATTKVNKMSDNIPKIKQFTVHQGDNISKGRIITISGGNVAVSAMVSGKENANAYEWNSADFSAVNGNNHQAIFVFDPSALDSGTRTISLTVTTNGRSSTRVLTLKLVGKYPLNWKDADNNGISDDKELKHTSNQLLAGVHTKITSPIGTKLLTGVMGENSGRLTLARMKQYVAVNSLPNNTKDTLITGDIYDFVVESLSTAGASTQVIIELATTIPENAELRKYSLTNGWANFVVDTDNIVQSKTSDTCTDASTWKTGLITGATCLKLTIKDGGENDTDDQTNGVIESTISIATPSVLYDDIRNNCIHNPNVYDGPYVVDFKCLLY